MKKWLLSSIVLLLLLIGCSLPDIPGMPTWDTTLKLNVLNDSYDLLELADEDSSIIAMEIVPGDSVLAIFQEETSEQDLDIGNTVAIYESEDAEIGEIGLPDMEPVEGAITFGEFVDAVEELTIPVGLESVDIDSTFDFDGIEQELETVQEIQWVEIMNGGFDLEITNNMIIGLGNYQDSLYLTLSLVHDNENVIPDIILTDRNLEPNDSYTVSVDLSETVLYRDMKLLISGGSRGTNGASAVIELSDELVTNITFWEEITASSAEARLSAQTIQDTVSMTFDDDYMLYEAEVADDPGYQLELYVENGLDMALSLHVEIPTLFIDSEVHYTGDFLIPRSSIGGGIFDLILSLGGAQLGDGTELMETIEIYTTAHIDSTLEDDFRNISFDDSYLVEAELSELEFSYIRGLIQPQEQDMITEIIELDVEYPEIEEGGLFTFVGDSDIRIDVDTGSSQIPGDLIIEATAYDKEGLMVQLVDGDSLAPHITIPAESSFSIPFSSDQYNINELLSILPERIEFKVLVIAGDGVSEVVYQQGDILRANITLESTLALAANTWVIPREDGEVMVTEEEIELDENEYNAFKSASLKLVYTNNTGLGISADILLSDSEENVINELYHFENTNLNNVDVIEVMDLEETMAGESKELTIELTQTDLDYLLSDFTYVGSRLHLLSSGTQALSGVVELIGQVEIVITISNDLIEDGEE